MTGKVMKQDSTKPISKTLEESKPVKKQRGRPKTLTNVEYFAGVYLNAVLGKMYNTSSSGMEDLKRQAYEFGEFMADIEDEDQ